MSPDHPAQAPLRHAFLTLATLLLLLLLGCTRAPVRRIEQVALAGDRIHVIATEGTLTHMIDGLTWYSNFKYFLLDYPAAAGAPPCPAARPTRILDAGIGLDTTRQHAGQRIDFLMGAHPDRILRVVRRATPSRLTQTIDLLGPHPSTRVWSVLATWTASDPPGRPSVIGTPDGGHLVFADPARVIDTKTLSEESRPDLDPMLRAARDAAAGRPSDFLFTDDLAYLRVGKLPKDPGNPSAEDWFVDRSWYVDRDAAQLHPIPEHAMVISNGDAVPPTVVKWDDWEERTRESYLGDAGSASPVWGFRFDDPRWGALLRGDAWDVRDHRTVRHHLDDRCGDIPLLIQAPNHLPEIRFIEVKIPFTVTR